LIWFPWSLHHLQELSKVWKWLLRSVFLWSKHLVRRASVTVFVEIVRFTRI
jgi:hypothetical protein